LFAILEGIYLQLDRLDDTDSEIRQLIGNVIVACFNDETAYFGLMMSALIQIIDKYRDDTSSPKVEEVCLTFNRIVDRMYIMHSRKLIDYDPVLRECNLFLAANRCSSNETGLRSIHNFIGKFYELNGE
jgi:hypothetical protein